MNAVSLAYSNAQKQHQEPSWIDDPFELKGFVTGVRQLSHDTNLKNYLDELVYTYSKYDDDCYELDIDKLSSPCQLELTRLYIESIDRDIEWACYGDDETLNSDFLCAMLLMLKDNTAKNREKFAQVTLKNLFIYYKQTLQDLIDTACQDRFLHEMQESGYSSDIDYDNGDVVWGKY